MAFSRSAVSRRIGQGAGMRGRFAPHALQLLMTISLGFCLGPEVAKAEADTLGRGDVSIAVSQSVDPYNRYWYHFNGPNDCNTDQATSPPEPCSRFNWNSYKVMQGLVINNQEQTIPTTIVGGTNLRVEFGALDRLTLGAETQLAYSNQSPTPWSLGDSRIALKWRALEGDASVLSLSGAVKLPGTYLPTQIGAPGSGQTDIELRGLLGGLAARRKFFYDIGFGYRMRLSFPTATMVSVEPADPSIAPVDDTCTQCLVTGPADELFMDFALGFYTSRRTLVFLNGALVNSFRGYDISDYFKLQTKAQSGDYTVTGDPAQLLTSLEEDYLRLGLGVLFKAYYNTTAYVNYSYVVLGKNTGALLVTDSGIPIGSVVVGLEYTFGTRTRPTSTLNARRSSLRESILTRRFNPGPVALR